MNVQVSGIAEELIQQMINNGEVATAEEAVQILAQRYLCGEEIAFSPIGCHPVGDDRFIAALQAVQ